MDNSQIKPDSGGKAIIPLVVGIISIIGGIGAVYLYASYSWANETILIVYSIIPIAGIILGKIILKGLKNPLMRFIVITGIVLCSISLIGVVLFYLYCQMMAQTL